MCVTEIKLAIIALAPVEVFINIIQSNIDGKLYPVFGDYRETS